MESPHFLRRSRSSRLRTAAVTIGALAVALALLPACAGTNACPNTDAAAQVEQAQSDTPLYVGKGDPYATGELDIATVNVARCELHAPVALRLFVPQQPDEYAVVLFLHGFMTRNSAYDEVLRHVASHGFVVVAPQMYEPGVAALLGEPTATKEAEQAIAVVDWIATHLGGVVEAGVRPERIGLAGHSRGGKVAWLVAGRDPSRILAIAGVDPVDDTGGPLGNQERVVQGSFALGIPSLILGTELGGACAPSGDNHVQFYEASSAPAWHFLALQQGHGDMLDEPEAKAAALLCPSGDDRAGMRRLTGGLLVALFRAALQGDASSYESLSAPAPDSAFDLIARK